MVSLTLRIVRGDKRNNHSSLVQTVNLNRFVMLSYFALSKAYTGMRPVVHKKFKAPT